MNICLNTSYNPPRYILTKTQWGELTIPSRNTYLNIHSLFRRCYVLSRSRKHEYSVINYHFAQNEEWKLDFVSKYIQSTCTINIVH